VRFESEIRDPKKLELSSKHQILRCVGVGEILWDLLPSGKQLGGAVTNFAYQAHALGLKAEVVSRVGSDQLGAAIRSRLEGMGISSANLQVDEQAPTGTVQVELAGAGVPTFTIRENVAWDRIEATQSALKAAECADAICFGSLAQRCEPSRRAIQALVSVTRPDALRVFDINLRQKFFSREVIETSLRLANVFKLNDGELPVLAELLGLTGSVRDQLAALAEGYELQLVALTRGPAGSLLLAGDQWSEHDGIRAGVVDTVGAGDAFTAAVTVGLLRGESLDEISQFANELAAYVCSCAGGTPPIPPRFKHIF
jgi:fructokinase